MAIDTNKIIEGPTFDIIKREAISRIVFYLESGDTVSDYEQEYGNTPNWTIPNSDYTLKVIESKRSPIIPNGTLPCIVKLTASSKPGTSGTYSSTDDLENKVVKYYLSSGIIIKPEWVGARKATSDDIDNAPNNVHGSTAVEGDYIWNNYDGADEPNLDDSEIDLSAISDSDIANTINKKYFCNIWHLEYYTRKNIDNINNLTGVNGTIIRKYAPYTLTKKVWKVLRDDKKLDYNGKGTKYTRILRECQAAPVINGVQTTWLNLDEWGRWE